MYFTFASLTLQTYIHTQTFLFYLFFACDACSRFGLTPRKISIVVVVDVFIVDVGSP